MGLFRMVDLNKPSNDRLVFEGGISLKFLPFDGGMIVQFIDESKDESANIWAKALLTPDEAREFAKALIATAEMVDEGCRTVFRGDR